LQSQDFKQSNISNLSIQESEKTLRKYSKKVNTLDDFHQNLEMQSLPSASLRILPPKQKEDGASVEKLSKSRLRA